MTRIEGATAPIVSELDTYQELLARIEHENERGAREDMRADREHARALGEAAVAEMRTRADLRLASSVVSAGVKIGGAVSSAAGTATSASRSGGELPLGDGSPGEGAAATAPATRHDDYGDHAGAVGSGLDGLGQAAAGLLDRLASDAEMRAERLRSAESEARSRADEAGRDADASARAREKLTDLYAAALGEKRRAEEAASRA
jgi:hypothetical protein